MSNQRMLEATMRRTPLAGAHGRRCRSWHWLRRCDLDSGHPGNHVKVWFSLVLGRWTDVQWRADR